MSDKKKERFRSGPENETYNKLKGKVVVVYPADTPTKRLVGELVWVDVYTFGLRRDKNQTVPSIVYKGPGMVIELAGATAEESFRE